MFTFEDVFPELSPKVDPALMCGRSQLPLAKAFMVSNPEAWERVVESNKVFKQFGGHDYTRITFFEVVPGTDDPVEIRDPNFDFSNKKIKITNNTVTTYDEDFNTCYNNIFVIFS